MNARREFLSCGPATSHPKRQAIAGQSRHSTRYQSPERGAAGSISASCRYSFLAASLVW